MREAGAVALLVLAGLAAAPALAQDERPRREVNVSLADDGCPSGPDRFCARPGTVTLEEGADLVLRVRNEGRIPHNLTFGPEAPDALAGHGMNGTLAPNESQRLRLPWPAVSEGLGDSGQGNVTLRCGFEGHAALGERLTVHVPALAGSGQRPQPGPGAWLALAAVGFAAWVARRR